MKKLSRRGFIGALSAIPLARKLKISKRITGSTGDGGGEDNGQGTHGITGSIGWTGYRDKNDTRDFVRAETANVFRHKNQIICEVSKPVHAGDLLCSDQDGRVRPWRPGFDDRPIIGIAAGSREAEGTRVGVLSIRVPPPV